MNTEPTAEQLRRKRANQYRKIIGYLREGKFDYAERYAQQHGMTVAEARSHTREELPESPEQYAAFVTATGQTPITPVIPIAAKPSPPPPQKPPVVVRTSTTTVDENYWYPWPVETRATIMRKCVNPKLLVIKLDDGREAVMFRAGRRWDLHTSLRVKLDAPQGDPRYWPIEGTVE